MKSYLDLIKAALRRRQYDSLITASIQQLPGDFLSLEQICVGSHSHSISGLIFVRQGSFHERIEALLVHLLQQKIRPITLSKRANLEKVAVHALGLIIA